MSTEDKMTIDERRKYLRIIRQRYRKANRKEKGWILDEMEAVTGMHRKSLIRLICGDLERQPRSRERGDTYGPEVDDALRVIAESRTTSVPIVSSRSWRIQPATWPSTVKWRYLPRCWSNWSALASPP